MTDHQQKAVSRSMTPKTPTVNPFKKGDIIWVVYRKSINWPAKVTAYYPKDRKVSYVFFPLVPKNAVFKTDPTKVQLFTLDDQLPENATADLEQCFEQARRVLQGVPEEEIIAENIQKAEETIAKPKKKVLTTADALKKSTPTEISMPKSYQKQLKGKAKETKFMQGDPIIVDTPMGMWPGMNQSKRVRSHRPDRFRGVVADGVDCPSPPLSLELCSVRLFVKKVHALCHGPHIPDRLVLPRRGQDHWGKPCGPQPNKNSDFCFISYVKGSPNKVNYSLFPREEHSHEVVQTGIEAVIPFPPDQIEQAIEDGRSSNSEVLLTALQDVQKYMNERGHKETPIGTTTSTSTAFMNTTPLTIAHPTGGGDLVTKEKKPKKHQPKVELTPPREAKQQPRMSLNSRLSSRIGDDENVVLTPPMQKSKKRTASQMVHAAVDDGVPTIGPKVKRRKELGLNEPDREAMARQGEGEEEEGTSKPFLKNWVNGNNAGSSSAVVGNSKMMSEAERNKQFANLGEKVEKMMRQKAIKEREQQQQHQTTSSSPTPTPTKEPPIVVKKAASEEAIPTITDHANKGLSAYDLARSILCRQHIESQLDNLGQQWFLDQLNTDDDFQFEFKKVELFTCDELESLVSTARQWFHDSVYVNFPPNVRFSELRELCLVSKHVLPEIGAFVLSVQNDCSFDEARSIYAEKLASSPISVDPSDISQKQLQVHKQNNKSLSTLIEAAKMMEGAASSEEQHQQNGVSMPNSPTEANNAMPLSCTNNLTIQADTDSAGDSE